MRDGCAKLLTPVWDSPGLQSSSVKLSASQLLLLSLLLPLHILSDDSGLYWPTSVGMTFQSVVYEIPHIIIILHLEIEA